MPDRSKPTAHSGSIANAIDDIRRKLVEEAWFGRSLDGPSPNYQEMVQSRYGPTTIYNSTNFYGPATIHGATTIYGPREAKPKTSERSGGREDRPERSAEPDRLGDPAGTPKPDYNELVTGWHGARREPEVHEHERGRSVDIER